MQSLKIIIFRDTDKPYTMIISSGVLIAIAFSLVALLSLFTFSVMSNVMFYGNGPQVPLMLASAADQPKTDEYTEETPAEESPNAEESTTEQQDDDPAEDTAGEIDDGYDDSVTEEPITQDPLPEELPEDTPVDDTPATTDDSSTTTQPVETSRPTSPVNTLSAITPYMPGESEVEAFLLRDATFGNSTIRVRAQVQKRLNLGQRYRGRFCVALVDNNGNIGPTYPNRMNIEGIEVLNPDRANTFRIGYRRNYDIQFDVDDPQNYSAIVFYLFDEETKTLQWRNSVPLTR